MRSVHYFLIFAAGAHSVSLRAAEKLSFNRDIRPILSDKCFHCHGPDKNTREADLRLDTSEGALAAKAIVPRDLKASEVYWRITAEDRDEVMPPPDSHKSLSAEEKKRIARWIEEGAEYEAHWAYLPVRRPRTEAAGSAAIDEIVSGRLQEEGLAFAEKADEIFLLRRLHFDLTGLPPAPADLTLFRETGVEAYVDRLLASPHFGERFAIPWLDAVRFADTHGYHGDQTVEVSPFRDWVIRSLNENMPFDQFTIEQIAGDLLPDATIAQQVAASYNRLGQSSSEGGIQDAEYLAKYQAERVRTTSTAWMGATLACAECHDHKFDPYSTKDFYQFAAFFSDILEKGAYTGDGSYQEETAPYEREGISFTSRGPALAVPEPAEVEALATLRSQLAAERAKLGADTPELAAGARAWAAGQRADLAAKVPFDHVVIREKGEEGGVDTKGWTFVTKDKGPVYEGSVSRLQKSGGLVQHIAKLGKDPLRISEGDTLYAYVWLDPKNPPKQIMLQFYNTNGGWKHRAWWGADEIPYGKGGEGPTHHRVGDLPKTGEWVRLEVETSALGLEALEELSEFAFTQFGGLVYWDQSGLATSNADYRFAGLPAPVKEALTKGAAELTEAQHKAILAHYRAFAPELERVRTTIVRLEKEITGVESKIRTVPATISAKRREIRILPRGNWMDKSGEVVSAATPHFLPALPDRTHSVSEASRLDLAKWLVSTENPLTARNFANRLWADFFGRGISGVVYDLGSQGEWPTHPRLLDWLAAEFMENGWDVKHLVKTIVLSEAYRQSSQSSPELRERDPYNRLFARQSAIRLPAELVRDNALAVSGLLNPEIGGRSVRPYQPAGYYQHLNFPRREYEPDQNEHQYRRGLYTHWQRTFLHPAMKAFDAPSREECTMEREVSSTPLQALVLLNDPSFVEAAKALAEGSRDIPDMFTKVLTREAEPEEIAALERLLASERERYTAEPDHAGGVLTVGMQQVAPDSSVEGVVKDRIELAARTSVARAILNLHETITRY